jgi:hypothetical protein
MISYIVTVACLPRPPGSIDCFHLREVHPQSLAPLITELSLEVTAQEEQPRANSVFLSLAGKARSPRAARTRRP